MVIVVNTSVASVLVILVSVTTVIMGYTWGNVTQLNGSKLKSQVTGNCGGPWKGKVSVSTFEYCDSGSGIYLAQCNTS